MTNRQVDDNQIRAELDRLLSVETIARSPMMCKFLKFVVHEELAGRGEDIKGYTVAVEALGRPESFDPQTDPSVRVQASRLRNALDLFYSEPANAGEIEIRLRKGSYRPSFIPVGPAIQTPSDAPQPTVATTALEQTKPPAADNRDVTSQKAPHQGITRIVVFAATLLFLAAGAAALFWIFDTEDPFDLSDRVVTHATTQQAKGRPDVRVLVLPFKTPEQDADTLSAYAAGLTAQLVTQMSISPWLAVNSTRWRGDVRETVGDFPNSAVSDYVLTGRLWSRPGEDVAVSVFIALREIPQFDIVWSRTFEIDGTTQSYHDSMKQLAVSVTDIVGSQRGLIARSARKRSQQINCLKRVVEAHPQCAECWAMLGYLHADEARKGEAFARLENWSRSEHAVDQAISLNPNGSLPLGAAMNLASSRKPRDLEKFVELSQRSLRLRPNYAIGLASYASKLGLYLGRWDEAEQFYKKALWLQPEPLAWYWLAPAYHSLVRGDGEALDEYANKLNRRTFSGYLLRAAGARQTGRVDEFKTLRQQLIERKASSAEKARQIVKKRGYHESLERAYLKEIEFIYSGGV